jgi:hypothetical protein
MNENNIFDTIDDALAERPSGHAWQRLESRLEQRVAERDGYRDRLRKQWTRQMIFTVGAVACLLFAAIVTVFYSLPQNEAIGKRAVAFSPAKATKTASGELGLEPSDTARADNRVLAKQHVQTAAPALNPAVMSDAAPVFPKKKPAANDLILPPQSVTSNDNTTGWNRKEVRAEAKQEVPKKVAEVEPLPPRNMVKNSAKNSAKNSVGNSLNNVASPPKAVAVAPSKNANSNAILIEADEDRTAAKKERKAKKAAAKAADNVPSTTASISDLYWLLGNWHNETDTRTPYEAWSSEGKYELRGTGYLVGAKGDTSRLETFRIKQEGNSLALYLPIDITGSVYRYELQNYEAYQWTFENEEMSFPQEIVLHRLSKDNFVFTMQNTDPHRVQNTKMRFQDPRISPLEDHTSRTMRRLNAR